MADPHQSAVFSGRAGAAIAATILAVTFVALAGCGRQPTATDSQPHAAAEATITESPPRDMDATILAADSSQEGPADRDERVTGPVAEASLPSEQREPTERVVSVEPSQENIDDTEIPETISPETSLWAESSGARSTAPFRLLLPTTAGLLLVDLDIQIGDQPLLDAFEQRIESIVEQAGGSSELTWNELLDYIAANPQMFAGAQVDSQQYRNMIRMYDRNRNKHPEPDEIAHLLFRDSGTSEPFRMFGSNFYRQTNRTQSPMFLALDRDGNQRLDTDEIQLAYESLSKLDRNGDRRIDIDEVLPSSGGRIQTNDAWNTRNTSRWGDVAMDLGGFVDWSMVSYSLAEASRQRVFHESDNAIATLDQNGDQTIDSDESRQLLEVPADLRLRIHFASALSTQPRIDVELPEREESTVVQMVEMGDRARILSDRFQLIATARDTRIGSNSIPLEAFAALDADKDGGLDKTEIPDGALREFSFEDLDQDEDGKLTHTELVEGMDPIAPVWAVQVRSRGAEAPDAIFTWLDQDQNGLLATRELLDCSARLQSLASEQGEVRAVDFPDTFLIQFGRGDPRQDETLFALAPVATKRNGSWPRWAESMDSNQDGDISREEFLGPTHQFDQLDLDHDGFLDGSEIK